MGENSMYRMILDRVPPVFPLEAVVTPHKGVYIGKRGTIVKHTSDGWYVVRLDVGVRITLKREDLVLLGGC